MTEIISSIYEGRVFHQRHRPRKHRLNYRVFSLLIDLDELPGLDRDLKTFGYNRFNVLSFWDKDHGPGDGRPLRPYIGELLAKTGIDIGEGRVGLLCYPRYFGYVFNPLSVYYCHDETERLRAMIYEVSNTFGERHSYLVETEDRGNTVIRQSCAKNFHVSPFIAMEADYHFHVTKPGDKLTLLIDQTDKDGALLKAGFSGRRRALNDASLIGVVVRHPLMTLKVVAGIHWEALKLWSKGVKILTRPEAPAESVTHVPAKEMEANP